MMRMRRRRLAVSFFGGSVWSRKCIDRKSERTD